MSIDLRVARPEDVAPFMTALARTFGEAMRDEDVADWRTRLEPDRVFVGWDGQLAVGGGAIYSMRFSVPGGDVAGGGVTAVGVLPTHRRQGMLRRMMGEMFAQGIERGEPVHFLWASEAAIYQRFGYGLAAFKARFDLPTPRSAFIEARPSSGRLRLIEQEEASRLLPPVYEAWRATRPGAWSRTEAWWRSLLDDPEWHRHGGGPRNLLVHERDGRVRGYAQYHLHEEWDERGPRDQLHVFEAIGLDPAAERDTWRFLCDMDLVRTVRYDLAPLDHPLLHLLREPNALGFTVGDALWARILDVPSALEARGYGAAGTIAFELRDEGLPANAGRWRLDTGSDRPRVARTDDPADLALDTSDLAAVYLGGVTLAQLQRAGRVQELVAGATPRADALFVSAVAPWSPRIF